MEIATGHFVHLKQWNKRKKRLAENSDTNAEIKKALEIMRMRIISIFNQISTSEESFGLTTIKKMFYGKHEKANSLMKAVEYHNNKVKLLIGKSYAKGTYDNYHYLETKLKSFLMHSLKLRDIPLKNLNHQFISEFENYLKIVHKNGSNTVGKNITNLRTIVNMALDMDWMDKNPFRNYRSKKIEPERTFLTRDEVKTIANAVMPSEHLETIKDCILFQIYTGLSYIDMKNLKIENVVRGIDGLPWIEVKRQKTKTRTSLPILPIAQIIIGKYSHHTIRLQEGRILPVTSNQKMNKQIKTIMRICNIQKRITSHSFRRTFATTITLSNGVPLETVSKMLGHADLKTTSTYAKVVDSKISTDMRKILALFK
jgi:site-specific recombinase XerD